MSKPKFPRAMALEVARELCAALKPVCEPGRLIVAGSLRRRKEWVGDVEIVYVPCQLELKDGLFDVRMVPAVDIVLRLMLEQGWLKQRLNVNGYPTWGDENKLAVHVGSGIPVDFFCTSELNWWNYLVCRTGSGESNIRIASAAKDKGWQWHPYHSGFTDDVGNVRTVASEREVFEFAGLAYREPWQR